ncbi:3'-5' exonuclease [Plasmodiophora brassicae]
MPRGGARPGAGRKRTRALSPAPTGGRQTSMHHFLGSATRAVSSSPDRDARALALPALPSSEPVTPANDSAVVIPPVSSSSRPDVASLPTSSSTLAAQPATNNALLRALEDSTSAALRMATAQGTAVRCLPGTAAAIAQTRDSPVMSSEASSPASSPPSSNSPVHSGVPPMPLLTTGSGSLDRFLRRFGRSGRDGSADHGADANELPFELQASDALLETSDSTDESDDGGITTDEDDEDSGHVDAGPSVQNRSRRISSAMRNHLECIVNDLRRDDSALLAGVKHGQCWVHPPVPCVRENIKDISLDLFYLVPVFIWDVETMFCDLQLKWPRCGHERFNKQIRGRPNVVRKGWTMGRRVVGRDRSYYVVTRRYRCGNCQARGLTPSTFSGHDPELLVSLPSFVRTVFPAFITHRSGIDKSVLDEMRSLVDHGVSIAGFARHLMETHTLRYTRTQIQYFGALQHCLHRFGYAFTKQQAISPQQFSAFDDPNGYDGFVPSASFLEAMYLKYLSEHRPLMDRLQQTVDGRVLKLDHSFKVPKLLRMFGPYPLFSALLTAVNEFEEPTLQRFTYSTSLNEVFVALRGYLLRCLLNGFELASVIVSDRCCQDASAFMEIIWVRKALARRDAFCSSLKRILDQLLSSVSSDTPIHAALSDLNVRVISAARHKAQTMLRIAVEDEDLPIEQSIVKNVVQMMSQTALLVAREVADGYSSNPAAPDDEIIGRVVASIASAIETVSKDTSMDDSSRRGADPFPAFCWPDPDGIVLNNTRAISDFCSAIRNLPIADRVVGFDTESNVTFMKDGARWKSITSPVCTVQIALRGHPPRVLQLLSDCPVGLKMLLEDPTVTKAGLSIEGDLKKLQKDFGVLMTGHVDVAKIGKRCGKIASSKVSLAHLMQRVFGVAMEKDPNIRVSDKWLKKPLPVEFVRYACRDAYACLALYDYFMQFNDCTVPIAPATVACGLRVDVVIGSNGKRLASGSITDLSSGPSGAVCVRLDEIHAPGLRLGSRMGIADIDFNRIERLPVCSSRVPVLR